jgi:peptidoglycan/xylan/chitin deacetylase (PgdA/CDA1 family)
MINQLFHTGKDIVSEILRQERCVWCNASDLTSFRTKVYARAYVNNSSVWKFFHSPDGKKPSEKVARVNKAPVRENVINAVKETLFRQNLPYISVDHYPAGFKVAAIFRADCDSAHRDSFFKMVRYSEKHNFPFSLFIDAGAQQQYADDVAAVQRNGQDVQLHCYSHKTYNSYSKNYENILLGKEILNKAGINVAGFASPFGEWNFSLNKALENLGITYSSEFSAGYDDLPFFPAVGHRYSSVLQVPVHPVCIGSMRNAGMDSKQMISYLEDKIRSKYERNSPLFFYGHPGKEVDEYPEVLDFLLSQLKQYEGVWLTTITQFAEWWRKRLAVEFSIVPGVNEYVVNTENTDPSITLCITSPDLKEAHLPLISGKYQADSLKWLASKSLSLQQTDEATIIRFRKLRIATWKFRHHQR